MTKDNERIDPTKEQDQFINDKSKAKKFTTPWNNKFGEDENFKNRQFSRSARNQPHKEATTLSKALLFFMMFLLIFPFLLYMYIDSQKDQQPQESKTAQQVVLDKSKSEKTTTTKEDQETTTTKESNVETRELQTTSREATQGTQAPATVAPTEAPVQSQSSTSHVVSAGESWWSISQAYGVDVYELAAANGSSIDGTLLPGSTIVIP